MSNVSGSCCYLVFSHEMDANECHQGHTKHKCLS